MPRSVVVAVAVLGVLVLFASTAFALVRSTQLRASRQQIAALESELARAAHGAAPSEPVEEPSAPGGPFGDGDDPLGDLFGDGGELGDLFGDNAQQLARCVEPAGPLGSRHVGAGEPDDQIARISEIVTDLRELEFDTPPQPQFLDDEQIAERLTEEIRSEYAREDAQLDARILGTLGAVPRDIDLRQLQEELMASQVAGFYDPDSGELVVRTGDTTQGLDPTAQTILAHELQHAVADQQLELPVDVTENTTEGDAALAALSVIEGDASLTQQQFSIVGLDLSDQLRLNSDPSVLESQRQLAEVPHYLAQSLQFPYIAGLQFVCARYLEGGWEAVNAMYEDLPASSAEIMDPARYPTAPVDPRDPGAPGEGWTDARTTTLGAADLWWLFGAPGDDTGRGLEQARDLALTWTGGKLAVWTDGDDTALGVALTQQQDGGPLCAAVATWYERAFPDSTEAPTRSGERMIRQDDEQSAVVACHDEEVRLGIAPDLDTARALVS